MFSCMSWRSKARTKVATWANEVEMKTCVAFCLEIAYPSGVLNVLGVRLRRPLKPRLENRAIIIERIFVEAE